MKRMLFWIMLLLGLTTATAGCQSDGDGFTRSGGFTGSDGHSGHDH